MKVICASFDYGFNWTIKDANDKVLAHFSTGTGTYVEKEVTGASPFTVEVGFPDKKGTWIKSGLADNAIIGVMRGENDPLISTAYPQS